ncbi:hypothetical protein [Neisseria weaveri]|uniref:HEPN domain-containing protein n=1 Tax=Neisseria weaveri TaxID=28091 RepID=A0A448VKY1_9NEIS|nr:hypothetical protein [Neisseria weaveri]EGV36034.1 hypothetical protein l13_10580 [Neisseria weaveri ATCC 51223]EGV38796.1 hypothetical protein l11_02430 [Neisseria weaveri LMG 5135]VEJ50418.1 Uncharacterised protein [Neisseria weaveri]
MIDPKDFVDSAKTMIGENEIGNRNAVSRMYYGVYHTGLQFAFNCLGFTYTSGYSMHKQLIDFFKQQNRRDLKVIGRQMEKLRNARNEADYTLETYVSPEDAKLDLRMAFQTISQIQQLQERP